MGIGRKMSASLLGFVTAVGTAFVVFFSADLKALDTLDFWVGTFLIFVLATLQILVFGWVWGARHGLQEANRGSILQLPPWLGWVMKYLSPVFLLGIFFMWLLVNVFGYRFGAESPNLSNYIKDLFVEPNLVAWMSVGIILLVLGLVCAIIANARPYQTNRPETSAQSKP
jgi:hypothetical protein